MFELNLLSICRQKVKFHWNKFHSVIFGVYYQQLILRTMPIHICMMEKEQDEERWHL